MGPVIEIIPQPTKSGKKAAILSVIAPLIAVMLNIASTMDLFKYSVYRPFLAAGALIAAWAGFLAAIVGLARGLNRFYASAIVYAFTGLLINAGLLAMAFGVMPCIKGLAGYSGKSKVTMLQLNSLPQVFENSSTVFDQKYSFRLELPAGFVENQDTSAAAGVIHSFVRYDSKGMPSITINVARLRRILAPRSGKPSIDQIEEFKRVVQKILPYAVIDKIEEETWRKHTLDVYLVEAPDRGKMVSMWVVQIPLVGEAVQVQVGGISGEYDQYRKILRQVLKSFKGISNWDEGIQKN